MIGSELYFSLFVGVVLSLIFAEKFGINPAGLVVPGYLALIFDQPIMLLSVLIISCLTYFIVSNGISKWVILYGRRKFAMILTGMVIKFIFDLLYPLTPFEMVEVSGIGVVILVLLRIQFKTRCSHYTFYNNVINMYYIYHLIFI